MSDTVTGSPLLHPKAVRGALTRYRVMAWVTGVFLVVMTGWLLLGYLLWDYGTVKPALYSRMWTVHGVLYPLYLITGIDLSFRLRYPVLRTLGILIAGTIPGMSFVADHIVAKDVHARLAAAGAVQSAVDGPR